MRINFTSEILSSMMSVKMLGLTEQMATMIQDMRVKEMNLSKRFRRLSSLNVCIVNLPSTLTRLVTFAAVAIVARLQANSSISTTRVITSLAILELMGGPLSGLLSAIPQAFAALGCFDRIQEFLLTESRLEQRSFDLDSPRTIGGYQLPSSQTNDMELQNIHLDPSSNGVSVRDKIVVRGGSFGWSGFRPPIIDKIELRIPHGTWLTIIVGPVGCGKSTLLKGLLGEASISMGLVQLETSDVAFCDQTPWITNGSIRENIVGPLKFEITWYNEVIWACALDRDLNQMADGDGTLLGSKGVLLSGGQKQRLVGF